MRSRLRIPSARCIALLLLFSQGVSLAYGLGPFVSGHCGCEHGPEVPCDCPHHAKHNGENPPPCHLHRKADGHANPSKPAPCSFRARCGSTPPVLMLLAIASVPSIDEPVAQHWILPSTTTAIVVHPSPFLSPPRPPPKVRI